MRMVVYLRVSTVAQAESEAGLRAQEDACRAHAARADADVDVVGPFADRGVSGAKPLDERPGLVAALAEVAPGDVLLVAKRDRLGRDPIVVAFIEKAIRQKGGRVASAAGEGTDDDSPASILMRRVIDGVAEYERLINKVRTCSALAAKKRRGQRTGSVPFGFALGDDGERSKTDRPLALVPDPADHEAAGEARRLQADGWSLRRIAAEFDRRQVPTKKGRGRWSHTSIRLLLRLDPATVAGPDVGGPIADEARGRGDDAGTRTRGERPCP